MGRLTEAAAAGSGASAASSAGPPPAPQPLSATSRGCTATMAFSEEDGTNGGASEAGEETEAPVKRRRLGWAATAWLTFYNIAMTAGYVRPEGPGSPPGPPRAAVPLTPRPGRRLAGGGRPAPKRAGGAYGRVCGAGRGVTGRGVTGRGGAAAGGRGAAAGGRPWGRGAGGAAAG